MKRVLTIRKKWRRKGKMPLGKYYCDYCDKQFQDTPAARKRHLQGLHHLRAKAQWYQSQSLSLHGPNEAFVADPLTKGLCNRFFKTGFCQFGDNCKYVHTKSNSQNQIPEAAAPETSWGNLPPSLKPPPEGGYPPLRFADWG